MHTLPKAGEKQTHTHRHTRYIHACEQGQLSLTQTDPYVKANEVGVGGRTFDEANASGFSYTQRSVSREILYSVTAAFKQQNTRAKKINVK